MQKRRWTLLCKLLTWSLPAYMLLLFLLIGIGSSIETTYGMSDTHFPSQFPNPFDTPTPTTTALPTPNPTPIASSTPITTRTPILTPTPTLIPTPVPTMQKQPTVIQTPQIKLTSNGIILPTQTMVAATPPIATPTSTLVPVSPTAVTSKVTTLKTTLTNQQLSNTGDGNKTLSTFVLPLSIGAPLLLASGGMWWLIRRRQMNQYKPGLLGSFDDTQPALWVSSRELDADHYALNYVTGASGSLPVPVIPEQPYMRSPTAPLSLSSSAYTPSGLPALPTSMRQPIPSISSNQPKRDLQEEDWLPWTNAPLNLPVQPVGASTFDRHEQAFSPVTSPMASVNTPVPFAPSPAWAQPVVAQPIHPPLTKGDSLLGEAMRQAQMGLFVVLGRE